MKKYTSILMLLAGSTALPLVGLLVILAVAEGGLFYLHNDPSFPLDSVFQSSRLGIAAAVVLFLWMAALLIPRFSRGSMTLARL